MGCTLPAKGKDESEDDYRDKLEEKMNSFNDLRSINKFHVYEGTARFRDKKRGQEQKQVDIMIAVDMLTHSFRRNMQEATLLTGDLDFKPLIDALVQDGMQVSLWYPKGKTNHQLIDAADSRTALTVDIIWDWVTEDFKSRFRLPTQGRLKHFNLGTGWNQIEEKRIQKKHYTAYFYQSGDEYASIVPTENQEYFLYEHSNLKQLEFYVKNIHDPNVVRRED